MATRISTLILLASLGVIAYVITLAIMPLLLHGFSEAGSVGAGALLKEALRAEAILALAFQLSIFAIYLCIPGRLQRVISAPLQQAVINSSLIAILAAALWLTVVYAAGEITTVKPVFVIVLVATTNALLLGAWFLRARRPMETLGVTLAFATVCIATPTSPDRALAIAAYAFSLALVYGLFFRRFGASASRLWRKGSLVLIVAAAHVVWITGLFIAGAVDAVPVWLAFASAALILTWGIALPVGALLLGTRTGLPGLLYDSRKEADTALHPQLLEPTAASADSNGKRAWIISYTGVSNEPRVLRQCEALLSDGWQVLVCGFDGHSPRPPEWTFVRLPQSYPFSGYFTQILVRSGRWARLALRYCGHTPLTRLLAHVAHGSTPLWLHIRLTLLDLAKAHPELRADLVIAHDYHTSDIGYAIAKHYGATFSIDVHEYAREQYSNDPEWVKWQRPTIIAIQDAYLRHSDVTTVVCKGIADLLVKETPLKTPPVVIRNVPFKNTQPFRETSEHITVLYHGDLSMPRDIHIAIASVPLWRPEFRLLLRGSGHADYVASLHKQIEQLGLQDRVSIVPPVSFEQIVAKANESDIGFFSYTSYSPQIQFALPNKIFEYIMAGLAVCITDLTEVGRIVNHYHNGYLIKQHSPEGIAAAINRFDRETIDDFKRASIAASEELHWELERTQLLQAYRSVMR